MADMTHYQRARKWLDNPDNRVPEDVAATLNASLAVSTATREITTEVRRGFHATAEQLHRMASSASMMVEFVGADGPLWVSPASVAYVSGSDPVAVGFVGGAVLQVNGSATEVAADLGVSA